jgi:REP element-mobilizing transposase RayT
MGSTYYRLYYHWVCSTKHRRRLIRAEWRQRFHQYLGGTVRGLGGVLLQAGGVEDHVHLLLSLKPAHRIADFTRELKKASSSWAGREHENSFAWQEGYSIFSVGPFGLTATRDYIANQEAHHQQLSFKEELERLLAEHGIEFRPEYLD